MIHRLFLSGKMTGLPDLGYAAFNDAASQLRARGFHVESPAENTAPQCGTWRGWMRKSIAQMLTCDAVVLLPNWCDNSDGARTEYTLAVNLRMPVWPLEFALTRKPERIAA
jgi:hypothetical protein